MRPPSACTPRRTTSSPTPRPERSDTLSAVEKPGAKIRLSTSSSARTASAAITPRSMAIARTRSRSRPWPSSATSMTIRPPRWAAEMRTRPSGGLPSAIRRSGLSRPWSTALRTMWVSGSVSRSMTVRSTSVDSPSTTSRTRLPVAASASRTSRAMRWNTAFTGWARMAITLSWMSRVSWLRSSSAWVTLSVRRQASAEMRSARMAWCTTSSPTRSTRRSTRGRSTRIAATSRTAAGGDAPPGRCSTVAASVGGSSGGGRLGRRCRRRRRSLGVRRHHQLAVALDELEHLEDLRFGRGRRERDGPAEVGVLGVEGVQHRHALGVELHDRLAQPPKLANEHQRLVALGVEARRRGGSGRARCARRRPAPAA